MELRDLAHPVPLEYCEIEVQAVVCERFYDFSVSAYGRSRIVNSSIILQFLGVSPQVFRPGMPFKTHVRHAFVFSFIEFYGKNMQYLTVYFKASCSLYGVFCENRITLITVTVLTQLSEN